MNAYRSHPCGALRAEHAGQKVVLSGWLHRKRDKKILFAQLRDHSGLVQLVFEVDHPLLETVRELRVESVLKIEGEVRLRGERDVNKDMPTGEVEVVPTGLEVLSKAEVLPFQVAEVDNAGETERLTYRFLDLRREKMQKNLALRSDVIASLRRRMIEQDFREFQTPILTSSSPEGARDYLVPSRLHPGKFYALPQAPQQFKQLLMVSGFPRYFQIAPCFRDEDARADRSPGEFYQLDVEMAFVTQDDVFEAIENVLDGVFGEFSDWERTPTPYPRIPYAEAMLKYGSDKPDLRFGLEIQDVTEVFRTSDFAAFRSVVEGGGVVRAVVAPQVAGNSRKFFDGIDKWSKGGDVGGKGIANLRFLEDGEVKGSVFKALGEAEIEALRSLPECEPGSAVFLVAGDEGLAATVAGRLRSKLGEDLDLIEKDAYRFCWIVDFPMFEWDEDNQKVDFSHNPFSMPQGGMEALESKDPLEILAFQYDIVCNGVELSSGAIRNHRPDIMLKAFEIAGYPAEEVEARFGGMLRAFRFGAPPHGGLAPGVDRIVMLLADEPNIREVILFPMIASAQCLLMDAPAEVRPEQLEELSLKIVAPQDPSKSPEGQEG